MYNKVYILGKKQQQKNVGLSLFLLIFFSLIYAHANVIEYYLGLSS